MLPLKDNLDPSTTINYLQDFVVGILLDHYATAIFSLNPRNVLTFSISVFEPGTITVQHISTLCWDRNNSM
jgi:hypothetical protein